MIGRAEIREGYLQTSGPPSLVAAAQQMIQGLEGEAALVFYAPNILHFLYSVVQGGEWVSADLAGPPGLRIEEGPWPLDVIPGPCAPFRAWETVGGLGVLHFRVTHSVRSSEDSPVAAVNGRIDWSGSGLRRIGCWAVRLAQGLARAWRHGEAQVHIAEDHWVLRMCDWLRVVVEARRIEDQVSCVWKTWDDLDLLDQRVRQALRIPDPPAIELADSPPGDLPLIGRIAEWVAGWFPCSAAEQGS
jgi:hypothetical protein